MSDCPESMELLKLFEYQHLPAALQPTSKMFADVATQIMDDIPDHFQRTDGLKKLLEAKDCIVRARMLTRSSLEASEWVDPEETGVLPPADTEVRVRNIIATDDKCEGFLVAPALVANRRPGGKGTYQGFAAGTGGDVWLIDHGSGGVAAYLTSELLVKRR